MQAKVDLFKLKLTAGDTMYFETPSEQLAWFDSKVLLSLENVSINGSRDVRLTGNFVDFMFEYNYCRYTLAGKTFYCFIKNFYYVNDNVTGVAIELDLVQTFMFEFKEGLRESIVSNMTLKDEDFNRYLPYVNKMQPQNYTATRLASFGNSIPNTQGLIGGFIMINIDNISDVNDNDGKLKLVTTPMLSDNGVTTGITCMLVPILYNINTNQLVQIDEYNYIDNTTNTSGTVVGSGLFEAFIADYGSYILNGNASIVFNAIPHIEFSSQNAISVYTTVEGVEQFRIVDLQVGNATRKVICVVNHNDSMVYNVGLASVLGNIPKPMQRSPYVAIRVGNDIDSVTLNLLDFFRGDLDNNGNLLVVEQFTSCLYPFATVCKFTYNGQTITDPHKLFSLTTIPPVPIKLTAWQEYYARNKASVDDGLETVHSYEKKELGIKTGFAWGKAMLNTALGFAGAANFQSTTNYTDKSQRWGGVRGSRSSSVKGTSTSITSSFSPVYSGIINGVGQIAGTALDTAEDYVLLDNQHEKEKALLEISWNDVKSSPSSYSNSASNLSAIYFKDSGVIVVDVYIATNIADIIRYHKLYGYDTQRVVQNPFNNFRKHTNYDYIKFYVTNFILELPLAFRSVIENLLSSGIRFWYNYENFLDLSVDNEEYNVS